MSGTLGHRSLLFPGSRALCTGLSPDNSPSFGQLTRSELAKGWFFCDCPGCPRVPRPWVLAIRRCNAWLPDAGALFGGPDWNKGLSLQPIVSRRGQTAGMQDSSTDGGPYRVRFADRHERSVPDEVGGPRFGCLDDALAFAHLQVNSRNAALIVEKLAPGGCWLQMARLD